MKRHKLLVIGSGRREFREYILRSAARHYQLALVEANPPTWQVPYICTYAVAPMTDVQAVIKAAASLRGRDGFAGIFTYDEALVEVAAEVAAQLNLEHCDAEPIRLCRDKLRSRRRFAESGVPSAAFREIGSLGDAAGAAAELGYPVVLKPRSLASSVGVVKVAARADLNDAYTHAASAKIPEMPTKPTLLIEEFLDGPEISLDAVITDDTVHFPVVARKQLGLPPFFEETGHIVSAVDPLLALNEAQDLAVSAIRALGLRRAIAHIEVRITNSGCRIVEVNPRLGGDLIPYLGFLATGVDMARAAADVAAAVPLHLSKTAAQAAGIRFFYSNEEMQFGSLQLELHHRPHWLDQFTTLSTTGAWIEPSGGGSWARLGFAVVTGTNAEECQARLDEIEDAVRIVPWVTAGISR